jgi:Flp pilus assembly protein TadB
VVTGWFLLGAGCGLGLWALLIWAAPARVPLGQALARLREPARPITAPATAPGEPVPWFVRAGRPMTGALRAAGLPSREVARDLAVTGREVDAYLAEQAICTLTGLLIAPAGTALLALAGQAPAPLMPVTGTLLLAAVGFIAPTIQVRTAAARRRRDFRYALSAYLDLVEVALAGGAGIEGALTEAASIGQGWAFTQLRRALDAARMTRTTVWATLRQLGDELNITELSELAASASLAGTEGSKIRASLDAKARTLRGHLLADAETRSNEATERMSLPWALMFVGFLIFICYPAIHTSLAHL